MNFEDIRNYFRDPPPNNLNKELAVCYMLCVFLESDSFGTELVQKLEALYPDMRLGERVLYAALKFLEGEGLIEGYWKKVEGQSRPRRMYKLDPNRRGTAEELAGYWEMHVRNLKIKEEQKVLKDAQ